MRKGLFSSSNCPIALSEGEFALGLGRRTFGETREEAAAGTYEIEWFERKGKSRKAWGKRPAFTCTRKGKPICKPNNEALRHFLPVVVETYSNKSPDEPVLTETCMNAVRLLMKEGEEGIESSRESEGEESEDVESLESGEEGESEVSSSEEDMTLLQLKEKLQKQTRKSPRLMDKG
jgi:hypothetical protein